MTEPPTCDIPLEGYGEKYPGIKITQQEYVCPGCGHVGCSWTVWNLWNYPAKCFQIICGECKTIWTRWPVKFHDDEFETREVTR